MEPEKIFFLVTKSNWGGAQKYVYDLSVYFKNRNFDVSVLTGSPQKYTTDPGAGVLLEKLKESRIKIILLDRIKRDISLMNEIYSIFELYKILAKEKPNIVHVNSSKMGGLGAFVARIAGMKKIIFTAHGWPFNEKRSIFTRLLMWFFSWLTVVFSHKTITVAKNDFIQGKKMPLVKKKIYLIQNGVSETEYLTKEVARENLAKKNNLANKRTFWIGTIAELHPNKSLGSLIDAVSTIPNTTLCLIGDGMSKDELQKRVDTLNIENRVIFAGFIKEASKYLKAFDLFVLPSIKEGQPFSVLEAGMAQIPVIASNLPGVKDIISSQECGILVAPGDKNEINIAIKELLNNEQKMLSMARNLNKMVMEKFSKEKMISETIAVYESKY